MCWTLIENIFEAFNGNGIYTRTTVNTCKSEMCKTIISSQTLYKHINYNTKPTTDDTTVYVIVRIWGW